MRGFVSGQSRYSSSALALWRWRQWLLAASTARPSSGGSRSRRRRRSSGGSFQPKAVFGHVDAPCCACSVVLSGELRQQGWCARVALGLRPLRFFGFHSCAARAVLENHIDASDIPHKVTLLLISPELPSPFQPNVCHTGTTASPPPPPTSLLNWTGGLHSRMRVTLAAPA